MTPEDGDILTVRSLSVHFPAACGAFKALDGFDLSLRPGEVLGLMGRSGSGKTLAATALMGIVEPPGRIVSGSVAIGGRELPICSESRMPRVRGLELFMIFQSPASALNPTLTIGRQLSEILVHRDGMKWKAARSRSEALLDRVHLPARLLDAYPFALSGGMQQRVLIAMALAIRPRILIADEPTTGLDVLTQARILDIFGRLRGELAGAILFISHDLRVLMNLAHRIAVMHAGRIVDTFPTSRLPEQTLSPHTRAILSAFREFETGGANRPC